MLSKGWPEDAVETFENAADAQVKLSEFKGWIFVKASRVCELEKALPDGVRELLSIGVKQTADNIEEPAEEEPEDEGSKEDSKEDNPQAEEEVEDESLEDENFESDEELDEDEEESPSDESEDDEDERFLS